MNIEKLLQKYQKRRENLIPILQQIQKELGYLPQNLFTQIAKHLNIKEIEVFRISTFYHQFKLTPPAKHGIKICLGTTCYLQGGKEFMKIVKKELKIKEGKKTLDKKFNLEKIACLGYCALAPVVVIDEKILPNMTPKKLEKIIKNRKKS
jgi:NADH-quinone oxidoreductase subunit E